jgi:hypothetical protein
MTAGSSTLPPLKRHVRSALSVYPLGFPHLIAAAGSGALN